MTGTPELQTLGSSAAVWQRYDRHVKADLWSTALRTSAGVYLVDPVTPDRDSLARFVADSHVLAVVITNENHVRDALAFGAPAFARFPLPGANVRSCELLPPEIQIVDVAGAAAGEIALVTATGELVVGDALINFEPYGFTFLPDKYCTDAKQMRRSLRQLLNHEFECILFAHGTPITRNARARLESLLS